MKVKITYYQGEKTWDEVIHANNLQEGRQIAETRNSNIKIIASNNTCTVEIYGEMCVVEMIVFNI